MKRTKEETIICEDCTKDGGVTIYAVDRAEECVLCRLKALEALAKDVTEETKESRKRYGSTMSFAVVTKIDKMEKQLEGGE